MAKIQNDKYYTSPELAEYCVRKTLEIIGEDNITEFVEPSAGSGVFLDYLNKHYLAFDIEPEDSRIVKQDWLENNLEYKKGRCIIGNPPFGNRNTLSVKFYKKSVQICDYIAFILPLSQYENSQQMYEFDLIYSEDLGMRIYTDRQLHCCFNIYKRNKNGLNNRPVCKFKDVEIKEYRRGSNNNSMNYNDYDMGVCTFGSGIIGKKTQYLGQYAKEMYFKILKEEYRDRVICVIENTDWDKEVCKGSSGQKNLTQWQIYKYLKEQIPELQ